MKVVRLKDACPLARVRAPSRDVISQRVWQLLDRAIKRAATPFAWVHVARRGPASPHISRVVSAYFHCSNLALRTRSGVGGSNQSLDLVFGRRLSSPFKLIRLAPWK